MNMNTRTSTRELYRNRDNSPLDRFQIWRVAPSVFADREDNSRSVVVGILSARWP